MVPTCDHCNVYDLHNGKAACSPRIVRIVKGTAYNNFTCRACYEARQEGKGDQIPTYDPSVRFASLPALTYSTFA